MLHSKTSWNIIFRYVITGTDLVFSIFTIPPHYTQLADAVKGGGGGIIVLYAALAANDNVTLQRDSFPTLLVISYRRVGRLSTRQTRRSCVSSHLSLSARSDVRVERLVIRNHCEASSEYRIISRLHELYSLHHAMHLSAHSLSVKWSLQTVH